jgi:hypothetical protein
MTRLGFLTLLGFALTSSASKHPVRQELIDQVNNSDALWTPTELHENIFTENFPVGGLQTHSESFFSLFSSGSNKQKASFFKEEERLGKIHLPKEFNSLEEWEMCSNMPILDQGYHCGSCWAVAQIYSY